MGRSLTVEERQEWGLRILKVIDAFCKENNITYYLSGGTLLGAVRHHGFIPWDDDMDLMMPRQDYEKFIHTFKNEQFAVASCTTDPDYFSPYARVYDTKETRMYRTVFKEKELGAFVDLFPIDGYPKNKLIKKIHLYRIKAAYALLHVRVRLKYEPREHYIPLKKFLHLFLRGGENKAAQKVNRLAQKYDYRKTESRGVLDLNIHLFREENPKEVYKQTVYLPFEDGMYPAPIGYTTYLTRLYGPRYMELPPEGKRKTGHTLVVEYKDGYEPIEETIEEPVEESVDI